MHVALDHIDHDSMVVRTCCCLLWSRQRRTPVQLGKTTVVGLDTPTFQVDFFGGIPYAQPPIGDLRFRFPVLSPTLSGTTFDASQFGPPCLQSPAADGMSEDCLSLNIFRPTGATSSAHLPVMAWIFGGGFAEGTSSLYNASLIVDQSVARGTPIVFVSLNYRLGPLGFPTGAEAQQQGALNLGLKDQLAALQWIQTNIQSFGGDKSKVTVFGQSAGASSIANLFFSSKLEKLARAAIFESGSQATTPFFSAASSTKLWQILAKSVPSCARVDPNHTFSCLRAADPSEILAAADIASAASPHEFAFIPVIDGKGGVIPDLPSKLLSSGSFARLPFIAGTNLDDGTDFTPTSINSTESVVQFAVNVTSSISSPRTPLPIFRDLFFRTLVDLYPDNPADGSPFGTGSNTFGLSPEYKRGAAILGDISFQALRRAWINAASLRGVKTFGYLFTDPQPNSGAAGVFHGSEVPYVFGLPILVGPPSAGNLTSKMIDYWVSFAVNLDPNDSRGSSRPNWPRYTPSNKVLMQLDSQNLTTIPDDYRHEQIEFINQNPIFLSH